MRNYIDELNADWEATKQDVELKKITPLKYMGLHLNLWAKHKPRKLKNLRNLIIDRSEFKE